jgi:hypothetical protein
MCFVWISEKIAIISLYSINWLVFITVVESVYSAVRTESLYIKQTRLDFKRLTKNLEGYAAFMESRSGIKRI